MVRLKAAGLLPLLVLFCCFRLAHTPLGCSIDVSKPCAAQHISWSEHCINWIPGLCVLHLDLERFRRKLALQI